MEWNIERTTSFIDDYHNSPELWNNKILQYKDIHIKKDKLKQLAAKYNCTVADVKNKIKNLRTAFHRERKKVQQKKSGSSPGKQTKWFAYEPLSFLLDVDIPKSTISTAGSDEENFEEEQHQHDQADLQEVNNKREEERQKYIAPKRKRKNSPISDREEEAYSILKNACQRDECSIYGEYVANELRKLSSVERTITQHNINNALFEAGIRRLDELDQASTPVCNSESNCFTVLSSETEYVPTITSAPLSTQLHSNCSYTIVSPEPSTSTLSQSQKNTK
ncbi:uncharacterized protein LOC129768983 [Toxorhynchites rutilus septentrionalis]|uniref:uncharacterized protein LOC129761889 n=1 Tax=Toxorhynchites rutilus septentrionalis TaxID=329112 RepID=UPI0024785E23|nr:uncharacterized protein LOC129761889 [Toxorhynchites rutilus septentrionalis]XP_055626920.1 uncharacterized protein LOC129768983 [Toxorhynchites rutilus septentrionalis]